MDQEGILMENQEGFFLDNLNQFSIEELEHMAKVNSYFTPLLFVPGCSCKLCGVSVYNYDDRKLHYEWHLRRGETL